MSDNTQENLTGAEKVMPYEKGREKSRQVRDMFNNIAPAYDVMNNLMSFGLHRVWRDRALGYCRNLNPRNILDIATGTGDVAIRMAQLWPQARVKGIDLSEGMLQVAEQKRQSLEGALAERLTFERADCLDLPEADNTYDLITVAYGVRNFAALAKGYAEMLRVLRPGGTLCVIELSRPTGKFARRAYDLYSNHLIPLAGKLVSGDNRAYSYLPESIAAAPQRREMAMIMKKTGFCRCRWISLTMGAVTIYLAMKPEKK